MCAVIKNTSPKVTKRERLEARRRECVDELWRLEQELDRVKGAFDLVFFDSRDVQDRVDRLSDRIAIVKGKISSIGNRLEAMDRRKLDDLSAVLLDPRRVPKNRRKFPSAPSPPYTGAVSYTYEISGEGPTSGSINVPGEDGTGNGIFWEGGRWVFRNDGGPVAAYLEEDSPDGQWTLAEGSPLLSLSTSLGAGS